MKDCIFEIEICQGSSFDRQSAILFTFENWEEAQKFILLALKHSLIVQIEALEKPEE